MTRSTSEPARITNIDIQAFNASTSSRAHWQPGIPSPSSMTVTASTRPRPLASMVTSM